MPTIIDCPSCNRQLRMPEELLGRSVKCPTCGNTFHGSVPGLPSKTQPSSGQAPDVHVQSDGKQGSVPVSQDQEGLPRQSDSSTGEAIPKLPASLEKCPKCGKHVSPEDFRCQYCGCVLEEEEGDERPWERPYRPPVRRDSEPHRGTMVLVLGILSLVVPLVGLPLGICGWVMGHRDLKKMRALAMDPEGLGLTQAGWICGMIGTILNTLWVMGCGLYIMFVVAMVSTMSRMPPPSATPVPFQTAPARYGPGPVPPDMAPKDGRPKQPGIDPKKDDGRPRPPRIDPKNPGR